MTDTLSEQSLPDLRIDITRRLLADDGVALDYDRGSVLRQVGLYHDPQFFLRRLETILSHPVTIARAFARKLTVK